MKSYLIGAAFALALGGQAFAQDASAPAAEPAAQTEQTTPPTEESAEAAAAAETQTQVPVAVEPPAAPLPEGISAPAEGMGQIVFFRPSRFVGAALSFTVRENEQALGRLSNGRYFVQQATPGIHEYEIGRNDTMRMEIEPGETYYVIQQTQMGVVAGRAVIMPSDQAAFETALPRMRVADPPRN